VGQSKLEIGSLGK